MNKTLAIIVVLLLGSISLAEEKPSAKYQPAEEFVQYLKDAANPAGFGLRGDGQFYPYSTRYGRRIGYGQVVAEKAMYATGWSAKDADKQLRQEIQKCAGELRDLLVKKQPGHPFDSLSLASQEILIDFAIYQGAGQIPDRVIQLVTAQDWKHFIGDYEYIRGSGGWPDVLRNYTFGQRWIYGKAALVQQ